MCDRMVVLASFDSFDDRNSVFQSPTRIIFVLLVVSQPTMDAVGAHPQSDKRWRQSQSVRHTAMSRVPTTSHWPEHRPTKEVTNIPPAARRSLSSRVETSKATRAELGWPSSSAFRPWQRPNLADDQRLTTRLPPGESNRRFRLLIDPIETLGGGGQ